MPVIGNLRRKGKRLEKEGTWAIMWGDLADDCREPHKIS
jgi:hypothetical protein